MPRSSKSSSQPEPTGPRLVRKSAPKRSTAATAPSAVAELAASPAVSHEQIALRAYELFVLDGCVHGYHVEHWLRAERELSEGAAVRSAGEAAGTRARR
jgi:hypothetical protein